MLDEEWRLEKNDEEESGRLASYGWALATGAGNLPCGRIPDRADDDVWVKDVVKAMSVLVK
jgi:hypothetical protein